MKKLNVLFVPTASSSVMYWRVQNWVEAAWRTGVASFQNPLWIKDHNNSHLPWQGKMTEGPNYDPMFIRQFVPMIESGCIGADAVVFQSAQEEGALELFEAIKIKFPRLPVLLEIDDNILSVPDYNQAFQTFDPRSDIRHRVLRQMKQADGVIVSTPHLKEIYSEYNPNIWVVPNAIDFKKWDRLKRKSKGGIRIGWAGGSAHEGDFSIVQDAIKRVMAKHPEAMLTFINGPAASGLPSYFQGIKNIEHKMRWEPILKYPQMLADFDFDIGIAPVLDSAFNRGKSNLKWLENSALGIPTVAMNVGHYAETITNGKDGYLCEDDNEFGLALDVLISDRKRRRAMGLAAQEKVRKDFNADSVVNHYVDCLEEAIAKKTYGEFITVDAVPCDVGSLAPQAEAPL